MNASSEPRLPELTRVPWHGHEIAVRRGGSGPTVVLVHGMAGSLRTWDAVFPGLAASCDVIAVDLPGHGDSSRQRGDFSLGSLAAAIRDVLDRLRVDRATVVGHSLGGGVAMQFVYQFPEHTERLVLVDSGGLGREVSPVLRAVSLPGAGLVLAGLGRVQQDRRVGAVGRFLRPVARRVWGDLPYLTREMATLADAATRASFLGTVHAVLDRAGQRVSATDRLPLARHLPTLIVWGERDRIIPVEHGRAAAELITGSRLRVLDGAGHYPHEEAPEWFVRTLLDFVATTSPAQLTSAEIAALEEAAERPVEPEE